MLLSKLLKPNSRKLIGNDVVDLSVAARESNWKRKGYLQKLFTSEEQVLILSSALPDVTLWLLWSMKEAAYKIYSRQKGISSFAPTSLRCHEITFKSNHYTGKVVVAGEDYLTQSCCDERMVHTICAVTREELRQTIVKIFLKEDIADFNYHDTNPDCVSHHGAFLALVYLSPGSPQ